jgi:V/A-type H+-transporting ATPase subunit A
MDLSAVISNYYSRAGRTTLRNGTKGSVTFIGTVSPAGGNLLEPVTESTKKVARCFFALSQQRADSKRYPAIDPMESYSKYFEYPEFEDYAKENIGDTWVDVVSNLKNSLIQGKEIYEQINILGDDGVPVTYHETFWKSELIDFVILQQDAFDKIDCNTPLDRQKYMVELVSKLIATEFTFDSFEDVSTYFKRIIYTLRQMNYSLFKSDEFKKFERELNEIVNERKVEE